MTAELFEQYLDWFNKMNARDRKAILLVDNCPAHKTSREYSHVKVVFLPANTTPILQPCDQGIIRAFKAHYQSRRLQMLSEIYKEIRGTQPLEPLSKSETARLSLNLLQAIKCSVISWNCLTEKTIENCWKRVGVIPAKFVDYPLENSEDDDSPLPEIENSPELTGLQELYPCLATELDQSNV